MTTALPSEHTRPAAAAQRTVPADLMARLADVPADRTALVAGGTSLTFGELRSLAARIAQNLTARGIGPESVVALALPRGADLVAALLGTLATGAAYLPVDPRLPSARRRYMVRDAGADLVVSAGAGQPPLSTDVPEATAASLGAASGDHEPAGFAPVAVSGGTLAYVIYTSGSTGTPKGVEITRAAASALLGELESAGIAQGTGARVGWNASPSFDASVQQWVRLCRGDTVVMIDEESRSDPALFARLIDEQELTDLDITPSHADALLEVLSTRASRRPLTLLIGGEAISSSLWRRVGGLCDEGVLRAVNLYGPTECTVDATAGWIDRRDEPHIGTVLPGLRTLVLDEGLNPVAPGETGELYLAGPRVGRGYRNRPRLTAERFVAGTTGDGDRMYRTGDLCRLLPDGRLAYLGRADGQVKLRGHRIELAEIERALADSPGVTEAAVVLREDLSGAPGLVAYVRSHGQLEEASLRERLAGRLPAFMVPSTFVRVDTFPTTAQGKLDRDALPLPAVTETAQPSGAEPRDAVEKLIATVWADVLGAPRISVDDNFFKLGGHSLLAIKLVSRVRAELGLSLPVKAVYAHPRLGDLAAHIASCAPGESR